MIPGLYWGFGKAGHGVANGWGLPPPPNPRWTPAPPLSSSGWGGLGQQPTDLQSLAGAVMSAFAADPNGCSNVCISGTGVNTAVHAFKVAWNQTGWGVDPVPAGTATLPGADAFASYGPLAHNGQYDDACAVAIAATGLTGVLGPCSTPCHAAPAPTSTSQPTSAPTGAPTAAPSGGGGTNYVPWILGGAAIVGVGIVGWAMYARPKSEALYAKARSMEEEARGLPRAQANPIKEEARVLHEAARHHMRLEEEEDRLSYQQRSHLPNSAFALPEKRRRGKGGLPLTDERGRLDPGHIRNAAARLSMMRHMGTVTPEQYRRARRRIISAACKTGVERTCLAA
jgi:hypothetical protein